MNIGSSISTPIQLFGLGYKGEEPLAMFFIPLLIIGTILARITLSIVEEQKE